MGFADFSDGNVGCHSVAGSELVTVAGEIQQAMRDESSARAALDNAANDMAKALLEGDRLNHVHGWNLKRLKIALRRVDGRNGRWLQ